jgi:hypothetical protein
MIFHYSIYGTGHQSVMTILLVNSKDKQPEDRFIADARIATLTAS